MTPPPHTRQLKKATGECVYGFRGQGLYQQEADGTVLFIKKLKILGKDRVSSMVSDKSDDPIEDPDYEPPSDDESEDESDSEGKQPRGRPARNSLVQQLPRLNKKKKIKKKIKQLNSHLPDDEAEQSDDQFSPCAERPPTPFMAEAASIEDLAPPVMDEYVPPDHEEQTFDSYPNLSDDEEPAPPVVDIEDLAQETKVRRLPRVDELRGTEDVIDALIALDVRPNLKLAPADRGASLL